MAANKKPGGAQKKRALVVDDDLNDLRIMKTILEEEGFDVFAAGDGEQALALVKGETFALILLDIRMPGLTGYELARMLRHKFDGSSKIIFVSVVPRDEADVAGVDAFVQKPFSRETLMAKVKAVMAKG